nr:MAG TPA: hypothetical protein [Caudoviricetes sp.]
MFSVKLYFYSRSTTIRLYCFIHVAMLIWRSETDRLPK